MDMTKAFPLHHTTSIHTLHDKIATVHSDGTVLWLKALCNVLTGRMVNLADRIVTADKRAVRDGNPISIDERNEADEAARTVDERKRRMADGDEMENSDAGKVDFRKQLELMTEARDAFRDICCTQALDPFDEPYSSEAYIGFVTKKPRPVRESDVIAQAKIEMRKPDLVRKQMMLDAQNANTRLLDNKAAIIELLNTYEGTEGRAISFNELEPATRYQILAQAGAKLMAIITQKRQFGRMDAGLGAILAKVRLEIALFGHELEKHFKDELDQAQRNGLRLNDVQEAVEVEDEHLPEAVAA